MLTNSNKFETISNRPGSPKKTIFLSQTLAPKRFEYMETDKRKSTISEITGHIARHFSNNAERSGTPKMRETGLDKSFRNLKLFSIPPSRRVFDNSLSCDQKLFQTKHRSLSRHGRQPSESSNGLNDSSGNLKSIIMKTDNEVRFREDGRRHNPIMYKNFTFDSLSQQLFNDKKEKPSKNFTHPKTGEFLILQGPKHKISLRTATSKPYYPGWKNGLFDLNTPYSHTEGSQLNRKKSSTSSMNSENSINCTPRTTNSKLAYNTNTKESKDQVNKYMPISRKTGGKAISTTTSATLTRPAFGKTDLAKQLRTGLDNYGNRMIF